jgi:hypothetical protein
VKKILVGILAAVVIFSGNALRAQYTHDNTRLQQDYADYNSAFFHDQLPKNTVVIWSGIPKEKDGRFVMGNTHHDIVGEAYTINIDIKSNITQSTADETLLHEMCHVKTMQYELEHNEDSHGPAFKACIVELELQGAYTDML